MTYDICPCCGKPKKPRGAVPGRWPSNLLHDGSDEVLAGFPAGRSAGLYNKGNHNGQNKNAGAANIPLDGLTAPQYNDTGSAARYFYCAKASKADRDEGLEGWTKRERDGNRPGSKDESGKFPDHDHRVMGGNHHPTVKPTSLMRYLCRLITPPGGVILDPFTGSGSTGKAAMLEGFRFLGIELQGDYADIARARIAKAAEQARQLEMEYEQAA